MILIMLILDDYTVVVYNHSDLSSAVGTGNTYNYIYLGQNITLQGGITIAASKTSLIIDGEYQGIRYTFTDINSSYSTDTLSIRSISSIRLTFTNITLIGRNYYGIPYVDDVLVNNPNVVITYENVTYSGPQMTYHPNGTVHYSNCDITIRQTGSSISEEVAEANQVQLGGRVRISHESTSVTSAVFWFRGNTATASLTVLQDADVEITSVNNYFMYSLDVFGTPLFVRYVIQSGASFTLNTNRGISYTNVHRVSSFLLDTNASFRYIQRSANGNYASLYINDSLTVQQGSELYMQSSFAGAQPLINFVVNSSQMNINNPKSFVLYNSVSAVISIQSAISTSFNITSGQINYWNPATSLTAGAGSLSDIPDYKWAKSDWSAFNVRGIITPTNTTVNSSDVPEEQLGNRFEYLQFQTARVLSIGDLRIIENLVADHGEPITGWTSPNAIIKIDYSITGISHSLDGVAESDGTFSVSTSGEDPAYVPPGTEVTIWANTPFLIARISTTSIADGELVLESVPQYIRSSTPILSVGTDTFFQRFSPEDYSIVVLDSRVDSTAWELLASIASDPQTSDGHTLPNSLVYRKNNGDVMSLANEPVAVYEGVSSGGVEMRTTISWAIDEGILIRAVGPIRLRVEYSTEVKWSLRIITP